MKNKNKIATVAIGLLFSTQLYSANGPMLFSDIDTNKDGKITASEYTIAKEKRLTEKAEDGRLLKNADKTNFSDIDANNDGIITKDEFKKHQLERFENRPGMGKNQ